MIRSAARRACSLMVALVLLLAPLMPGGAPGRGCGQCPPGCPMHARRLGCHHARALPCHGGGSSNAIRSACGHAPEPAAPSGGMRGVIPATVGLSPLFAARSASTHTRVLVTQHAPEPTTDPPRRIA